MAVVETTVDQPPPSFEVVGGYSLKRRLARAERRNKVRAFLLVVPLLAFLSIAFLAPICYMLFRSFYQPLIANNLPETIAVLKDWSADRHPLPSEPAFAALGHELNKLYVNDNLGQVATRLNFELSGMRNAVMKTGRHVNMLLKKGEKPTDWKKKLISIDRRWSKPETWTTIKNAGHAFTLAFYLNALDYTYGKDGRIVQRDPFRQIYLLTGWDSVWARTVIISAIVTALCVLFGYPVAFLLANLPLRISNLLMILVLLPFWTSLLVRTTAWVVVLQKEGVLNDLMMFLGLFHHRMQLIYDRFGVVCAMTHILLPFMILPIYSVMKTIPPSYVRAARNLGATPWTAFWRVYFPQSMPGIGAGGLLVFILALGYYITPALVGGPTDQMVSYFIAYHTTHSLNWGLACSLGVILLLGVLGVYIIYDKLVGIDNMKLG